jgi:hypothetical protein
VERVLGFAEWGMVMTNLIVAVILTVDAVRDGGPDYQYLIAAVYLAYSLFAVFRRLRRQKSEVHFAPTIKGELDKAIFQVDYLIRQANSIIYWYILPLTLIVTVSFLLNDKLLWALTLILVLVPVSVVGPRWEINKWYLPKKRDLESLREMLLADVGEVVG